MKSILGIDAAWTLGNDSGTALIVETNIGSWRTVAVASSYDGFLAKAGMSRPSIFSELPDALVKACHFLACGSDLSLVVADIPLARSPISSRRVADNEVSRKYGGQGCSTHSPPKTGFGLISQTLRDGFADVGFPLATGAMLDHCLVETYPHPALMALMQVDYRVRYKARAWKEVPAAESKWKRIEQFQAIVEQLSQHIEGIDFCWPIGTVSQSELKALEDQIDALVCAWVGIQMLLGGAEPLGDENAAIWLPRDIPKRRVHHVN